jgi:hypothetical protein
VGLRIGILSCLYRGIFFHGDFAGQVAWGVTEYMELLLLVNDDLGGIWEISGM